MTLLAISNLVTISEKNTTKDNQKKKSRLTKDDEKKRFLCANIDFFCFVAFISTFKRNYLHIDLFIMIARDIHI